MQPEPLQLEPLPSPDPRVVRFRARDRASGRLLEVLRPRAGEEADRFLAFHRERGAAVVDGAAVRPWPGDRSLADLAVPLPAALVPPLLGWLGARLAEGPPLPAGLAPQDVRLDREGRPHLAPLGLPPAPARAPDPWLAPERRRGEAPSRAADLYALGALGHWLATGGWPGDLPPGRDTTLAGVVGGLLAEDPTRRAAALPPEPPAPPRLPLPDAPSLAAARLPVRTTRAGGEARGGASELLRLPRRPLLVPVGGLSAGARVRLARCTGLPLPVVEGVAEAGAPLLLDAGDLPTDPAILEAEGLPVAAAGPASGGLALVAAGAAGALGWGLLSAWWAIPLALAAGLATGTALAARRRRTLARAIRATAAARARHPEGPLAGAYARLARAWGEVRLARDLPATAAADLRARLSEAGERLDDILERRARGEEGGPAEPDLDDIERRIREARSLGDALEATSLATGRDPG